MFTPSRTTAALLAALLAATGCGKKEAPKPAETPAAVQPAAPAPAPLAVGTIDLGKSVDATSKVATAAESFGPRDTIYASVATTGAGTGATLAAKWSFVKASGALIPVNESSQTITTTGPVNTEFHITKATPWPKGKYRVEISLNGAAAGTKDFEVK
jgi:hypothetical protein